MCYNCCQSKGVFTGPLASNLPGRNFLLETNFITKQIELQEEAFCKKALLYQNPTVSPKACILYFHGGGLLYGSRKDLPELHLESLTGAGYPIISFDYPLAPAAKLDRILADICLSVNSYIEKPDLFGLPKLPYLLFGRSAGAYLCLLTAAKGDLLSPPSAILSYYGYGFLCDSWFKEKSPYYLTLPKVEEDLISSLYGTLHTEGDLNTHYSAYVYARQSGNWLSMMYEGREKYFYLDYSLRTCEKLPAPLFCAHSTQDPDVPYAEFQELQKRYHPTVFIASGKVHDFDRDTDNPQTRELLEKTLSFLDTVFE